MKTEVIDKENGNSKKIDRLFVVLDEDIEHIKRTLSCLNELRSLVIKRDDTGLAKLLEGIQTESNSYAANESKRRSIRKELADFFGCDMKQMTLTRLESELGEEEKAELAERKSKLRTLISELKTEHLSTAMLLSECARLNGLLLRGVFNLGNTATVTYNSDGFAKRQRDTTFVNMQF